MSKLIDPSAIQLCRHNAAGVCEHCRRPCEAGHVHHIFPKSMGGSRRVDIACNLIFLDATCHTIAHQGNLPRATLLEIVARRDRMTPDAIQDRVWAIQRGEATS